MNIKCLLILMALTSCGGPKYETQNYQAISLNKRDTARLKLSTSENSFYGSYQIRYSGTTKDDGTISGHVIGDTLVGKFSYLSRDNVKVIEPIALLRRGENLQLGTGIIGTYLGLRVYQFGSIVFKDSLFLFRPLDSEKYTVSANLP